MNSIDTILLHYCLSHLYDTGATPGSTFAWR